MKNKKALSGIVVTLITVAIALVAVGIVWYVVNNVIQTQQEAVTEASNEVFLTCAQAGYLEMDESDESLDECAGVVKYVGGEMCCEGTLS